ncbi:MAG TPA: aldo/keto reductase [Streptosporangiaceae bacterium]|jgi:aryl-alcohol dehydrogenase-like predicted oxidoreductase
MSGTWRLGDLEVSRIGFGAMRLSQRGAAFSAGAPASDRQQVISVLRRAVELGVNHIDTAAFYFSALRSANELINSTLSPYPGDLVIVTKVGPARDYAGEWLPTPPPGGLRGQVEENLRQLGRDHLDVVNLRLQPGMEPLADYFGALAELRQAGLIRHLGISGVRPGQLAEARKVAPVVCVQNAHSLARRESAPVLRECGALGIAFVPFFAIARSGRHRGMTGPEPAGLTAIARAHEATPAQVALAWTLHQGPHVLAIPGTGDADHLTENVAAGAIALSAAELAVLDALPGQ